MKQIVLFACILFCCRPGIAQTVFDRTDSVVTYHADSPAGSRANPNVQFALNIVKWVRTPKMAWNTDRYKCYLIGNIPFRLRYPDSYVPGVNDGKKYPIMIFWHGGGEANPNIRDNEFQLLNGGQAFEDKVRFDQDAFVIFPQSRAVGWDDSYFTPMNIVIDSLIKNCKGDEDRVISMGLSIGGTASIDYALAYPKRVSTIISSSPVFITQYFNIIGPAIHIPLWVGNGGKDVNPDPASFEAFINGYGPTGGNLYWSFYPQQGHVMWDYQWAEEPNFGDVWRKAHKANPLIYFNNRFFCPGSPVSSRLGITGGHFAYQWDKDGVIIPTATSNEYIATDFGTYRARFKRTASSDWSAWSLAPAVIAPICPPVNGNGTGLRGTYYNNVDLTEPSSINRVDPVLNFVWDFNTSPVAPLGVDHYSVRWTGKIQPQFSETYTIYTKSDDGVRLWINGVQLINNFTDHGTTEDVGTINLVAGQKYDIKIEYYNRNGGGLSFLKWSSPSTIKQTVPTKQLYPDGTGNPDLPLCATNVLPANNAALAPATTTTLKWKRIFNATSYDVYVWTGATAPLTPTGTSTDTSYTATGLVPGATYSWYVAPRNSTGAATGCNNNTNKSNFTINPPAPFCATNTAPGNGSTLATQNTATLSWGAVAAATSYDVYIWTGATAPLTPTANTSSPTYNATGLIAGTLYNWYVVPKNITGSATGCDLFNKTNFITAASGAAPGCATNTAPLNGTTLSTQTTATLTWGTVSTATSYDVYLWTGAIAPLTPTTSTTATSYNASGLTPSSVYNWYVVPKNASGPAVNCDINNRAIFTTASVIVPVPGCANNTAPTNGTTIATQTTATLTWSTVATASSYDVYLWTGATAPLTPTTNTTATNFSATGLTPSSLYNWYVVPKNASGPAANCDINNKSTFTTASIPVPVCATNTAPTNGTTIGTQSTATLSWGTVATATSYDVYLWTGATAPLTPITNTTSTTYNATGLTPSSLYNWYVVPKNANGPAANCDINNKSTFTTAAIPVPVCATNIAPTNGTTIGTQSTATLSWGTVATATSYDVYLWTGATAPLTPTTNTTATNFSATGLTPSSLYNWYVVPKNASGPAANCDINNKSTFTTAAIPVPVCATNIAPTNGTTLATQTTASLKWKSAATATSYDLYLWTGPTAPLTPTANVTDTVFASSGLSVFTLYTWYVVPKNASGPAVGCDISNKTSFTTASVVVPAPSCIANTLPADGATIATQTTASLKWRSAATATSYDLYLWTGPTAPITPTATVTDTVFAASGLSAFTLYTWYVVPKNASGPAVGCDISNKTSFTTAPVVVPAPSCVTNTLPSNGATLATQTTASLKWRSAATATSYDLYLWTGATAPLTPTATVTDTVFAASGLSAFTLYTWYVVPKNASGPAVGCDINNKTSFTTAPVVVPAPSCVTNTLPANGATLATQTTASLKWRSAATATSYDLYLWTGATAPLTPTANVTDTVFAATGLAASTLYNWYVVPKNASGPAVGCDINNKTTFTTASIPVPVCVTNTAPTNGTTIGTQTTASLKWRLAATATSYDVYLWTGATAPLTPTANVTDTVFAATGLAASTLYNWYVVPKNASGPAVGCDINNKTSFTTASVVVPAPSCVANTLPADGATIATQTTASLKWRSAATATSYDLYLWTGPTAPLTPTATVTDTVFAATGLAASTLYNWYVVPKNASGPAVGCDINNKTSFTTASVVVPAPSCVANTLPADGATIATQTTASLKWRSAATATSYDLYLWTGATAPLTPTANVTDTVFAATGLAASTLYNWYVVPKNASGPAVGCDINNKTSFTTAPVVVPAPSCVTNTLPANGATLATQTTASLKWRSAATATSYDLYLWTGPTAPLTPTATVTDTVFAATGLAASTLYNWYVVPKNASGPAVGCDISNKTSFTTAAVVVPAPSCVSNTLPADGATIATQTTASLKWRLAATATSYDLYLWTGPTAPLTPTANVTDTVFAATGLAASTLYNWYVVPKNAGGPAVGCDINNKTSFTTASVVVPAPSCVTNTLPANGATLATQTTASLKWRSAATATSYDLYLWTGPTAPVTPTANVTDTVFAASGLSVFTLYTWYVVPKNASGPAVGCDINNKTTFTTASIPVPVCATNTAPTNGTTIATQTTASLKWRLAATATSYDVYLWTGATAPLTPTANVTDTVFAASGLAASTLYNWYVVPKNASGPAVGCDINNKTTFTTASIPVPVCVTNTAPTNGTTIGTQTTASLKWRLAATATSYDVYLWTGATAPLTPTANVTDTVFAASGLSEFTLYNWYVVPKNASGPAVSCDINNKTTFTTASIPVPVCVTNTAPTNGTTIGTQSTATLSWSTVATATSYDVYLWTGATAPLTPTTNTIATSFSATGLTPSSLYNWYVVPKNASGPAANCDINNKSTFTTAAATAGLGTGLQGVYYPGIALTGTPLLTRIDTTVNMELTYSKQPVILTPAPGIVPEDLFSIRWSGKVQPLFSESYIFYASTDDGVRLWVNGVQLINNWVNQGTTEKSGTITLVANQKYDIIMEYFENTGEAVAKLSWSSPSTPKAIIPKLRLFPPGATAAPSCTLNSSPAGGSTVATASAATLAWNAATDASSYDVYLWTGATAPLTPTVNLTTTSYAATGLTGATVYNWYVVPRNEIGAATGCSINSTSFTTAVPPPPPPACTVNLSPANNAVLVTANTAILTWTDAPTATSYDVYLWTGATVPVVPTANSATATYTATGLSASTTYSWFVVPKNAGGDATGCIANKTTFVTAAPPAPACAVNTSPLNGSTVATPNTAALSWNVALNAASYDVFVWTGATAPLTPTANTTTASYTATGLSASTTYSWYVVPKNATGAATGCSTANKFNFTTSSPAAGIGLQGAYYNNITLTGTPVITRVDPTINFDFIYQQAAPGVTLENYSVRWTGKVKPLYSETYTFYANTDDGVRLWVNGIQLVDNWVNQGATEKSGTITLVAGQKYDIILEYYQGTGYASTKLSWSSASTPKAIIPASQLYPPGFVDPTIPACAINITPASASTVAAATTATLVWNTVADASAYDVYIWTGATPAATAIATNITTATTTATYTVTGLTGATLYTWYVIPKNAAGAPSGCISNSTTFTTAVPPPPAPVCTVNATPANNALLATANTATLNWTAAANATAYDLYIWTGATAPLTPTVSGITATTYTANGLTASTTYNWYVVPKNAGGSATGCNTSKTAFVTAAPPAPSCTVNTAPADGSIILTSTTATLTWNAAANASSYDVYIWTGATAPLTPTANVSAATYAATGLNVGSLYNWYVIPKNAAGSAAGCSTSARTSFTTASAAPGTGLQGDYFNNITLTGSPVVTRIDPTVNFDFVYQQAAPGVTLENYSVRWTGQVKPLFSEAYTFYVTTDDGVRLWVNGVQLVNNWVNQGATEKSGTITLVAGTRYDIVMEYYQGTGYATSKLSWASASTAKAIIPATQLYPPGAAARVASAAFTAVQPAAAQLSAAVTASPQLSSTISPNPVKPGQAARLQLSSDKPGTGTVNIINSNGFIISQQRISLVKGINTSMINTTSLGQGFYIISVVGGSKPVNIKLLIE